MNLDWMWAVVVYINWVLIEEMDHIKWGY